MAEVIKMPKMSDTMTEGVIVAWHKKVGDAVKPGDILAEVETDKATMELENYSKGVLLHIGIPEGQAVPVDAVIAIVGAAGEDVSALLATSSSSSAKSTPAPTPESTTITAPAAPVVATTPVESSDDRLKASPLARKMAEEKGVSLGQIKGSGENGRIVKRDVESFTPGASAPSITAVNGQESYEEITLSQMRKTIARRLSESMFTAPHFYLTMEIRMDKAVAGRKALNDLGEAKISMNDIVIKAVAAALRKHPKVNSSWLGDKIRINHHIHIGVAMAVEDGLVVPVIKFADQKSLSHISAEVKQFADKAKNKKLQPEEFSGNTFTVSNLGMYGIEEFTAIINPPDACILAIGTVKETAVVENGQLVPGQVMKVTLSCDHRAVDGAVGSAFLQTLKKYLEEPLALVM